MEDSEPSAQVIHTLTDSPKSRLPGKAGTTKLPTLRFHPPLGRYLDLVLESAV
jgi:hypothetical protein